MRYVICDLEATCWEKDTSITRQEIIEIGAVMLSSEVGPAVGEFAEFVRPLSEPMLTDFCKKLTTITQEEVDGAAPFREVFPRFLAWIGPEPFRFASWGSYDLRQFREQCRREKIALPAMFEDHINLKYVFAEKRKTHPMGMAQALHKLGWALEGRHHRGIDDARNIARIAMTILAE